MAAREYCPACGRDVRTKPTPDGEVFWRHQPDTYVSYRGHRSDPCVNSNEPAGQVALRVLVGIPVPEERPDFDQTVQTFDEARSLLKARIKDDFAGVECSDCRAQAKAARRSLSWHLTPGDFAAEIDGSLYEIRQVNAEGTD